MKSLDKHLSIVFCEANAEIKEKFIKAKGYFRTTIARARKLIAILTFVHAMLRGTNTCSAIRSAMADRCESALRLRGMLPLPMPMQEYLNEWLSRNNVPELTGYEGEIPNDL